MPTYRFDAFKLNVTATGEVASAGDVMRLLSESEDDNSAQVGAFTRDLWRLRRNRRPTGWFGQFRKFREGDLPLVGAPGEEGEELAIAEDKGLIEKNFFLVCAPHDILLWHVNGHANTPNQFTQFLSELVGARVVADPIVQPNAMRRLMRGGVELRKVHMRVARPTNPEWYPNDDFSREIIDLLAKGGGDSLTLQSSVDGRLAPTNQTELAGRWKRAIRELVGDGLATSARVEVLEDGVDYPIDLIADRLLSHITVEHDGRYAPTETMLQALADAWADIRGSVDEIFGEEGASLRR
ncbi:MULTISPECIES: hypothetical protein [Stenotrophomonas]|uniref:hypothetical protein n=1 Tax=Stenotrophomonas TaxID=40323 RepID=UPI000A6ED628|nr:MULTISPECIES: hypothetical protein [Stenotrophomonas]WMJ68824.1 hypothetical protein Q9R17_16805 [Stenotrophomonas sp. 24(2023)]